MPDSMLGGGNAQTQADEQGDLVLREPPRLCASHNSNNAELQTRACSSWIEVLSS